MVTALLYGLTGLGLFALGLYALITQAHLLRKLLAINVLGGGIFLVLGGLTRRLADNQIDPVPHAMVITGIVVDIAATALGLAIVMRIHALTGHTTLPEERE